MPTYDYECGACEHRFELFQSITAAAVKKCPVCGKRKVRRLIGTGAGIIFKGSGFYCTDYRGKEYSEAARKDSSGTGGSASPSQGDGASAGGGAKEAGAKASGGEASASASGAGNGSASSSPATATTTKQPAKSSATPAGGNGKT